MITLTASILRIKLLFCKRNTALVIIYYKRFQYIIYSIMHMGMSLINLIEIDIKRFIDTHSIHTVRTQYNVQCEATVRT